MGLKCGIVGLPNVGKSTIFNALTKAGAAVENYPFCTIEPNKGIVEVPDFRLGRLKDIYKPSKVIPAIIEFVDIAGLVKGASKGEGLGNQFLSHIREVDVICHVLRAFDDSNIIHVHGKVDPIDDAKVINYELIMADLESADKQKKKLEKAVKNGDKEGIRLFEILSKIMVSLEQGKYARIADLTQEELQLAKIFHLITLKPVLYVANMDDKKVNDVTLEHLKNIEIFAKEENASFTSLCGKFEDEISTLTDEEKLEFLKEINQTQTGLEKMILKSYELLNLITFLTAGEVEVRAWTVAKNSKAPIAAAVIHSDFEKAFIKAEVMKFEDINRLGSPVKVKEEGKMRIEGKEYLVQDGDVIFFHIGK